MKFLLFSVLFFLSSPLFAQSIPAYKNAKLPIESRVQDLLQRMTIEEKFFQLFMIPDDWSDGGAKFKNGIFGLQINRDNNANDVAAQMLNYNSSDDEKAFAAKVNAIQKYFVEQTRLGIPAIIFEEGLHGIITKGATVYPQSIALAATFDTSLMHQVAHSMGMEAKKRGIHQVLSPVINLASDVRWGRTEETYGEDPFLSSAMGLAFVSELEKMNIITTPKHFVANVGDGGRDSYPIHFDENFMNEYFYPPFKTCIKYGGSRSIMAAYNSLNGISCSMNNDLLNRKLKQEWGFKGFVISDAGGVGGANVLHNTTKDYAESSKQAINNGLDVIFQTSFEHYKLFIPPFLDGSISMKRIDDAVSRVLRAKFELGLFEHPFVEENIADTNFQPKKVALQAALESIVLLKNESTILPLNEKMKAISVIGKDAMEARLGGYSGVGNNKVNILDGIKSRTKNFATIKFAEGCGRENEEWKIVPTENLIAADASKGLSAKYFNNITLEGNVAVEKNVEQINFHYTLSSPDEKIKNDFFSARFEGQIKSPKTGSYKIGLDGNDGFRLYLDGKLLIDNWTKQTYSTRLTDFYFEANKTYHIKVEFYEPTGNAQLRLIWNVDVENNWQQKIKEAVDLVKQSDVAIVDVGITEGEFQDRALLSLPGHQEEMLEQIAATGKPVVVILSGGSAITMNSWLSKVSAVIDAWYPGEEGGNAVAAVLFGDYNPSGKLPITFPLNEGQLPLVYNHQPTGRGDDYNNSSGFPLFPFGFGLSYTTFDFSDLKMDKTTFEKTDSTTLHFNIKNTGTKDGDEVIQLYIKDMLASVARPVMELKAFNRVHLKAGETKNISFKITPQMLSMWNADGKEVIESGDFQVMIGTSSREIKLKEMIRVK